MGVYGAPFRDITPNIDAFSEDALVVKGMYNSSTPTINGLIAIVCSYMPTTSHTQWRKDRLGEILLDPLCMPEVLRDYHNYMVTQGDPYYTYTRPFFESQGMEKVFAAPDIYEFLQEKPRGRIFGYSDHQVMRYLIEALKRGLFKEPFSLVVSTVDLHPPFKLPPDLVRYPYRDHPVLHLTYNVDDAFGRFWRFFQNSPYFKKTIVVLTADHAMQPSAEYKNLFPGEGITAFDRIPFILYDPIHALPRELRLPSSQVDILPSLLHLLGRNVPNPFEGLSIFDPEGRPAHPDILGLSPYQFFYLTNGRYFYTDTATLDCKENHPGFDFCDILLWFRTKQYLAYTQKIWH